MSEIFCERYEGISDTINCRKCEHVNMCASYDEYMEAEVSKICQRHTDFV
ncbi:MAG: hypothetical protein L7F77_04810 [Candidatus Magnetominusculus sp. LBB02]|nr:hypothetical protein [Candidatus Magnetominusculus sp. LBB02]